MRINIEKVNKYLLLFCKAFVIGMGLYTLGYIMCEAYEIAGYYDDLYAKNVIEYNKHYIPDRLLNKKVFENDSQKLKNVDTFWIITPTTPKVPKKVNATHTELQMFAYTVEMEAHDLSLEHKQAIAKVIVNRVNHKDFKHRNLKDVLTAKKQFQGYHNYIRKKFHPNLDTMIACRQALAGEINLSDDIVYFYNPRKSRAKYSNFFERKTLAFEMDGHRFFLSK